VTVHSDYAFTTRHYNVDIKVGDNRLNGEQALGFARERYALSDGDRQRGRDQMEVIKAVINEMASSKMLYNYTDIMDAISDCFQTSMPKDMIQSLVKMQINDMKKWNVVSYSVDGTGTRASTFSIPGRDNLWVMIPDENTINYAKELIQQVIDGKVISE
ncbi:MAG: LCP family protein, partial [Clostridiales bacterium]|nr:LCP family protein [Clostridiales bacterium]